MNRLPTLSLFVLGLSLPVAAAFAAPYPPPIEAATHHGIKVVRQFPAPSGLTGWVLEQDGRAGIAYTTADNRTLITGTLLDADWRNLTAAHAKQYVPKPDLAALYRQLEKAPAVREGAAAAKSVVYVFMDANCIYCNLTWRALQPYEKAGLEVRWVPVAILKPSSPGRAAALLEAARPAAALAWNETRFDRKAEEGGLAPAARPKPATLRGLAANLALMRRFGFQGTPGFVWRDAAGRVKTREGMPDLAELPAVTRLPAQKQTDPQLARRP